MEIKYTKSAKKVLTLAKECNLYYKKDYIGTEHLLMGLIKENKGFAGKLLRENNVALQEIIVFFERFSKDLGYNEIDNSFKNVKYSPRYTKILEAAKNESDNFSKAEVGTEHILLAIIKNLDCIANQILKNSGYNLINLYNSILLTNFENKNDLPTKNRNEDNNFEEDIYDDILEEYSTDFTELARENKFDNIIGRENELNRLMQILTRRNKNNPCLIGEPGVGKTAIVEGLAQKIIKNEVPKALQNKRLLSLDLSAVVAGTKYRGEFEERINNIINEVIVENDIILFIDEIHTLIGTGGAEGSLDASNILKPYLARGQIQLIGATTIEEYRKYIEKNTSLERRFQPILVEETNEEESIEIIMGLKSLYEKYHGLKISDNAIKKAVNFSIRYIPDRFLPDKAIDLIDETASRLKIKNFAKPKDIKEIQDEIKLLERKKEIAIINEFYEEATNIRLTQEKKRKKLDRLLNKYKSNYKNSELILEDDDVADTISIWTKIPVQRLKADESQKLKNLENILKENVISQEEAISAVSRAIKRGRLGIKDPKKPIGSFIFLGPTGVGKTELSKALAICLFGSENSLIRIDMSEYMEKHSISKLIGSPPGYVGYEEGGGLSKKVRQNPYSIILFDEIEKAHHDIFNLLLQILDDGYMNDSHGRKVSFKNTIIIMTSNIGAKSIISQKQMGFLATDDTEFEYNNIKAKVFEELRQAFKPEFLNRLDEVIVFKQLSKDDIKKILEILIKDLNSRLKEQLDINIKFTDEAKNYIIEKAYDKKYGARPLKRKLQVLVEDKLAEYILEDKISKGDRVLVNYKDNELKFDAEI